MIYLILSILSTSLIFIIFRLFSTFNINTQQAIVANYFTATTFGLIAYSEPVNILSLPEYDWFYGTIFLGLVFILVFNLTAITTQKNGLSVAAVASKMSVVIPVIFGILVYEESTGILKVIGIIIALIAVYLTAMKNSDGISIKKGNLIFPILVFIGSGIIDASIKFLDSNYVAENDSPLFSATIFGFAGITGVTVLLIKVAQKKTKISYRNIIAGIILGIPNYGSIYFLIQALRQENIDSSTIFTINNVAVLLVSTLVGIAFFKEKLIFKNWIGIILAITSIVLVTLSI